jgi:hypothetical protein
MQKDTTDYCLAKLIGDPYVGFEKDLTIIHYTANLINGYFANAVREHLLKTVGDIPIISISHRPINFGKNICVGDIGISTYNIYKQILIGAKEVKTKYLACTEDDCLYTKSHFSHRPPDDETFSYNQNNWTLDKSGIFFRRNRANMRMCISPTELVVRILEKRFEKFPNLLSPSELYGWGEPGREKVKLQLGEEGNIEIFESYIPCISFNHNTGMGKARKILQKDKIVKELFLWGKAEDMWEEFMGQWV